MTNGQKEVIRCREYVGDRLSSIWETEKCEERGREKCQVAATALEEARAHVRGICAGRRTRRGVGYPDCSAWEASEKGRRRAVDSMGLEERRQVLVGNNTVRNGQC